MYKLVGYLCFVSGMEVSERFRYTAIEHPRSIHVMLLFYKNNSFRLYDLYPC